MSMIAIWLRSRSAFMSSRICAWMVTSSAVVGSSAISSSGFVESAIAIITRWRMPPDSWCGYSLARRFGVGDADLAEHLHRARPSASPAADRLVQLHRLGDLVAAGEDRVERRHRLLEDHRDLVAADVAHLLSRDLEQVPAAQHHAPSTIRPGARMSRIIDIAVMLLPQPDSPTTPSVLPSRISNVTPSTALTVPSCVKKWVRSASIVRSSPARCFARRRRPRPRRHLLDPLTRVEGIAKTVSEEAGPEHQEDEHEPGYRIRSALRKKYSLRVVEHVAQAGVGRADAEAEEAAGPPP